MSIIDPATRKEMYLDVIRRLALGESVDVSDLIEPGDREERFLYDICKNYSGGGSTVEVEPLDVMENGVYDEGEGKAYSPVNVGVPNSYEEVDVGRVVRQTTGPGVYELAEQTSYDETITENGTYDTTYYNSVTVDVPKPSGTIIIRTNALINVSEYKYADVNVSADPVALTISGTLAAPFGNNAAIAYMAAAHVYNFVNKGYKATLTIDGTALGIGTESIVIQTITKSGNDYKIWANGMSPDATSISDASGAATVLTVNGTGTTVDTAFLLGGGALTDVSAYAAALPTVITYYGDGT